MRNLGVVAISFCGLLAITSAPAFLTSAVSVQYWDAAEFERVLLMMFSLVPAALALLLGMWLIRQRHVLAGRWFEDTDAGIAIDPQALLRVGLIILGLTMAIPAVPTLIFDALNMQSTLGAVGDPDATLGVLGASSIVAYSLGSLAFPIFNLVVGILLIARSDSIAGRLWQTPRSKPRPVVAEEATSVSRCPQCDSPYDASDYVDMRAAKCAACGSEL